MLTVIVRFYHQPSHVLTIDESELDDVRAYYLTGYHYHIRSLVIHRPA